MTYYNELRAAQKKNSLRTAEPHYNDPFRLPMQMRAMY